jgi:hypothetical protein
MTSGVARQPGTRLIVLRIYTLNRQALANQS